VVEIVKDSRGLVPNNFTKLRLNRGNSYELGGRYESRNDFTLFGHAMRSIDPGYVSTAELVEFFAAAMRHRIADAIATF
jgi:hypothetical protein